MRVSQAWAGPGYGFVTLPRVGDEVLIAFMDGDPDEPMIVGRVHNGKNLSPLTLPAENTVSTWRSKSSPGGDGYNEILMDDAAGAERLSIHAQRDFNQKVERDVDAWVGRNVTVKIDGDKQIKVKGTGDAQFGQPCRLTGPDCEIIATDRISLKSSLIEFQADRAATPRAATYTTRAAPCCRQRADDGPREHNHPVGPAPDHHIAGGIKIITAVLWTSMARRSTELLIEVVVKITRVGSLGVLGVPDVAELRQPRRRAFVITGPSGSGKTRTSRPSVRRKSIAGYGLPPRAERWRRSDGPASRSICCSMARPREDLQAARARRLELGGARPSEAAPVRVAHALSRWSREVGAPQGRVLSCGAASRLRGWASGGPIDDLPAQGSHARAEIQLGTAMLEQLSGRAPPARSTR